MPKLPASSSTKVYTHVKIERETHARIKRIAAKWGTHQKEVVRFLSELAEQYESAADMLNAIEAGNGKETVLNWTGPGWYAFRADGSQSLLIAEYLSYQQVPATFVAGGIFDDGHERFACLWCDNEDAARAAMT